MSDLNNSGSSRAAARVRVIGGGLAGPEAAYQLARLGLAVELWEMRPCVSTPAHRTGSLGELVCSNSLKSEARDSAPWLLKEELRRGGSLLLRCAAEAAVPGGQALTVDRGVFSAAIEAGLEAAGVHVIRQEARTVASEGVTVLATGPLTSGPLLEALAAITGRAHLGFYDAISPIVEADSIVRESGFGGSRYGKGGDDYWNCPLDRTQFEGFYAALRNAESYPLHDFEEPRYFEACLPLEELARRGPETLRHGPMKPVGLPDPRSGKIPYAVVQLRRENLRADSFNLVGFQNHLRFADQASVLRLIPGLGQARFLRYGQVHRNTYLLAPAVLRPDLGLRARPEILIAGQLCGTEGYIEAIATGFLAGRFAAARALGRAAAPPPRETALGSLLHYIIHARLEDYAPANITLDLLPELVHAPRDRAARREKICQRALAAATAWLEAQPTVLTREMPGARA